MDIFFTDNKLIASVLLIAVALILRSLVIHMLRNRPVTDGEVLKRWINTVNNVTQLLTVLGLIAIWLSELRYFALSIAAFVVALVIATREFIQCILGALYIASTRQFSVGDWIKVNNSAGEVVSSDWLSTTLLEVDIEGQSYEYTGKTLFIPNNLFVTNSVVNLNFMRRYVAHTFAITREADAVNVCEAKQFILQKANEYCAGFHEVAERYNGLIEKRLGVNISGPEASVRISSNNLAKNIFTITVFCPTPEAVTIEQQLTEDFLNFWYQSLQQKSENQPETNNVKPLINDARG